jgi:hypothetical protein
MLPRVLQATSATTGPVSEEFPSQTRLPVYVSSTQLSFYYTLKMGGTNSDEIFVSTDLLGPTIENE